jgi:erythrocyte band 7 integral membrane protein
VYEKIDMRTKTYEIPPQEILTKDSVTVFVNAIMYYKVANATNAVANVDDYSGSARLLAATTLRNVLGTLNLGDILSQRESIAREMQSTLDETTVEWGVKVERVEVKDVRVPAQLMRAMAAEAEAAREARAKVIAAEGEHKASRSLRQAAEVIMDSPAALQLRYLQTLNSISAENNSTVIFPVPIDIMSHFMSSHNSSRAPDTNPFPTPIPPQPANIHMKPHQQQRPALKTQASLQQLIGIIDDVKVPLEDLDDAIEGESPDLELDIPELDIPELEVPDIDFKLDEVDLLPPDIDFPADIDMKKV